MNKDNATVAEKNRKLDDYMEEGNYKKVDEISRELCRLQGFEPVDKMPSDFLFQLKKKEKKEMKNVKKISKNFTRVSAVAAGFLLIGGIASAAEKYYTTNVITFTNGISTGDSDAAYSFVTKEGEFLFNEESTTDIIEHEYGNSNQTWLEKKVMDETYSAYKSDDNSNWYPYEVTDRITEYKYEKYSDAVKDANFVNAFTKDYSGVVYYRERQYMLEETETSSSNIIDYSISADLEYGSSSFNMEQLKLLKYDESIEVDSSSSFVAYVTDDEISNERTYTASSGYEYVLADDIESGKSVTVVMIQGEEYELVFTFTDMEDDEIYDILESIDIKEIVEF